MKIKIDNYVLAAGGKESPSSMDIDGKVIVDVQTRLRAQASKPKNRDNLQTNIGFSITREHANTRAAETFLVEHAADLPREGLLTLFMTDDNGGETELYLPNAVIDSDRGKHIGATTIITYSIVGGKITRTKPSVTSGS